MKVRIVAGFPGAGKSTWVAAHTYSGTHAPPRVCVFAPGFTHDLDAHAVERRRVLLDYEAVLRTRAADEVWVDDVNLRLVDVVPFYELALAHGASVGITQVVTPYATCLDRCRAAQRLPRPEELARLWEQVKRFRYELPVEYRYQLVSGQGGGP